MGEPTRIISESTQITVQKILDKVRGRRVQLRFTQEYMACALNISTQTYQLLESGRICLSASYIIDIADILHVHPSYFWILDEPLTDEKYMKDRVNLQSKYKNKE